MTQRRARVLGPRCLTALLVAAGACAHPRPTSTYSDRQFASGCYLLSWTPDSLRPRLDSLYLSGGPIGTRRPGPPGWAVVDDCWPASDNLCSGELLWTLDADRLTIKDQWADLRISARLRADGFAGVARANAAAWGGSRRWNIRARRVDCS